MSTRPLVSFFCGNWGDWYETRPWSYLNPKPFPDLYVTLDHVLESHGRPQVVPRAKTEVSQFYQGDHCFLYYHLGPSATQVLDPTEGPPPQSHKNPGTSNELSKDPF